MGFVVGDWHGRGLHTLVDAISPYKAQRTDRLARPLSIQYTGTGSSVGGIPRCQWGVPPTRVTVTRGSPKVTLPGMTREHKEHVVRYLYWFGS